MTLCACGKPLHYVDPIVERTMADIVATLGPTIELSASGSSWEVPRHYIALHGFTALELPALARKYSWPKVSEETT